MQQHVDICPMLLLAMHNVLGTCRHGGRKRIRGDKQKRLLAELQPIELQDSDTMYCTCGTPPPAEYNQGGLQPLYQTCLTQTEDLSQRIDSLQHSVESKLTSDREFIESTNSVYDKIEHLCNKIFPDAFLAMERTTKENDDADSMIFDSSAEGVLRNYDLSQRIDRLQHSVESLLASKRVVIQIAGSRFGRLEHFYKRVFPDAFLAMEKTIKEHEDVDSTIFDYTMEDVLPDYDLFQRFNRLQHSVDSVVAYTSDFLISITSRSRSLRRQVYPYAVLAVEQIEKRARGCKHQNLQ